MPVVYPVKVYATSTESPHRWGIFDSASNWACMAPSEKLAFASNQYELAANVAKAINHAWRMGVDAKAWEIRNALGLEE